LAQFVHHCVNLFVIWSLGIENRLGIVEDYDHLLGGKKGTQGCQILRVFDPRTDDLGQSSEEMNTRSEELLAANESTVISESCLDAVVVENSERNRRLPDSPCADESDGLELFGTADNLLD
jgi:hypothetical protein